MLGVDGTSLDGVKDTPGAGGGGCIWVVTAGGGRDGILSSAEEVSTVMFLVDTGAVRNVYNTGEHLMAIEGFLCPGR